MERRRAGAARSAGLCKRDPAGFPVGALHVVGSYRPGLVFVRVGNPVVGNGLSGDFFVSVTRWPTVSPATVARASHLAVSLAGVSNHVRRRSDQNSRRRMLARSDMPLLPLRDAAHPQPAELVAPFPSTLVSPVWRGLEPLH